MLFVCQAAPDALVAKRVPPEAASYHLMFPPLEVAFRFTTPVPVLLPGVVLVIVRLVTVAATVVLEAEVHEPSTASA